MGLKRPFREGDRILVVPERIGPRGEALAVVDGWRVRVTGGIPGERAAARVLHVSKGGPVASARWLDADPPHPARRPPPCPIHDRCGGCGLQQLRADAALDMKVAQAQRTFPAVRWLEPLRSPREFAYRAKAFLLPQRRGTELMLGARPPRGARLVDVSGCNVLRPELEALADRARDALRSRRDLETQLRSILLRSNRVGECQATLVHRGGGRDLERDLAAVARALGATRAFLQRHDRPGNLICSDNAEREVRGRDPVAESYAGVETVVPPTAFVQGNPDVAEPLYEEAAAALEGGRIAELFCGAGVAGLLALRRFPNATLQGIDRSRRAIEAARANARRNGLADRCRFVAQPAEQAPGDWDAVMVNPPRGGCAAAVIDAIRDSRARSLVYLSCNPESLARDARRLGWRPDWVRPADMYPQTPHLELLVRFTRS